MQYLNKFKGNLSKKFFDNNDNQSKAEQNKKQQVEDKKQSKMTSIAKALLNKLTQKQDQKERKQEQHKAQLKPPVLVDGRIWLTSKMSESCNENSLKQTPEQNSQEVNEEDAAIFVSNICNFQAFNEKQKLMRRNRAKNEIFGKLEIEPIYLQENINKILRMQFQESYSYLCSQKCQSLIERTQNLVIERDAVDRSIQQVLSSGYLWKANDLDTCNIVDICYETISKSSDNAAKLLQEVDKVRKKFKIFLQYFRKVNLLNRRRCELLKKIKLVKKINAVKKDICIQFENLDQAFHIQRNRQKMYQQLSEKPIVSEKLTITKNLLALTTKRNMKVCHLVESLILQWIDKGKKMEQKSIEKLLILVYFIKNEKMYRQNKLRIDLSRIVNKNEFIKQLTKVRSWQKYRYVNDKSVKEKVSQLVQDLIQQLNKTNSQLQKEKQKSLVKKKSLKPDPIKSNEGGSKSENVQF